MILGVALMGLPFTSSPAFGEAHIRNSSQYELAARPLRNATEVPFRFSQARLSDVLRMLADEAGINFISLPSDQTDASRLVTFTFEMSPFAALETMAQDNGIALVYNNRGFWSLKASNSSELVAKSYYIQHNTKEKIEVSDSSSGSSSSSRGGAAGGAGPSTGIDLQGGPSTVFKVEPSQLIDDVKEILGIPTGTGSLLSNEAYLQLLGGGGSGGILSPQASNIVDPGSHEDSAKVLWNSDSNSLFVVATIAQHQMVTEYLKDADRPQALIAVEVKFFETTKDPKRQLGIDWSGTLGDNGLGASLSSLTTDVNLNFIKNTVAPQSAVLNSQDLNVTMRALITDTETTQVSYPRVLTVSNREVVIRSVINEPVLAASSSTTPGAGATTSSAVQYLPIGTVINILPREMANDTVALDVQLTVSSIIGERVISGNPYPIASSRVYSSPLRVQSGYTVAIAGLDEALNTNGKNSVPLLGRLPILGELFRNRSKIHSRKNLMMFITPTLIRTNTRGISNKPHAVLTSRNELGRYRNGSAQFNDPREEGIRRLRSQRRS
jgi:type II secretory pathway component GspD/PulD (secretin)